MIRKGVESLLDGGVPARRIRHDAIEDMATGGG
jgi:hypothetical protein